MPQTPATAPTDWNTPDRLRLILDSLPAGVSVLTAVRDAAGNVVDFHYVFSNATDTAFVGKANPTGGAVAGRLLSEIFPGLATTSFFNCFREAVLTGQPQTAEDPYHADGVDGWFSTTAKPYGDDLVVYYTDVTARKEAKQLIRQEADRTQALLDSVQTGVIRFSTIRDEAGAIADFRYDYINQEAERHHKYPREQVLGSPMLDLYPGVKDEGLYKIMLQVMESGQPHRLRTHYTHEGYDHWFDIVFLRQGQQLIQTTLDISEYKRAEAQVRQQATLLQTVLDNVQVGIGLMDAVRNPAGEVVDFRYRFTNEANARITGLPVDYMTGRLMAEALPGTHGPGGVFEFFVETMNADLPRHLPLHYEADGISGYYDLTVVRCNDGVLFSSLDVTALMQTQLAQQEQAELLAGILAGTQAGVSVFESVRDPAGQIVDFRYWDVNPAAARFGGYAREDMVGRLMTELLPNARSSGLFDAHRRVAETGEPAVIPDMHYRDERHETWGNLHLRQHRDGLVTTYVDTTALKQMEQQQRHQAELFQSMLDNSQAGIFRIRPVYDAAGTLCNFTFTQVNHTLARLAALVPADLVGRLFTDIFPSAISQGLVGEYARIYTQGTPERLELHYHADGLDNWYEVLANRHGDELLVNYIDTTERQRQRELLQAIIDHSPVGLSLLEAVRNRQGEVVDFRYQITNPVNAANVHLTVEKMLGRRWLDLFPRHGVLYDRMVATLASGQSARFQYLSQAEGADKWYDCTFVRFGDGVLINFADITLMKNYQETLERINSDLRRSNAELERFAYVASHDMSEPLRKIRTFARLLSDRHAHQLDTDGVLYLDRMVVAAQRMQLLIDSILTFSRVGRKEQPFVAVDLREVLRQAESDLEMAIQEKQAVIEAEGLPTVTAEPAQMHQLLLNLLGNALKYSRPGLHPVVRVAAAPATEAEVLRLNLPPGAAYTRLTVADNGIGFDAKYAERIFEVFQRLHGHSDYEGAGIGLAICRKIAENHGGGIFAEGRVGAGATFTVVLPAP